MVSCLVFKSLSHFEFIFMYGKKVCSNFIDLHMTKFSNTTCKKTVFSHCIFLPHLLKSN